MSSRITFQTRARTVDHLGRGQIADCPTAISELWKNAYDAYAGEVELHVFSGEAPVAAVIDNGCGMTLKDFQDFWLVIGTESKIEKKEPTEEERFGLPWHPKQGEKGIGRLSAAFIAPITLIVSKKVNQPYVAAMVDWRLFENPFLSLHDIGVALEEFNSLEELSDLLPNMFATLKENLTGESGSKERAEALKNGWKRFDDYEREQNHKITTSSKICKSYREGLVSSRHLRDWIALLNEDSEAARHGTSIFMIDSHPELAALVDPDLFMEDEELEAIKKRLWETLACFTDHYSDSPIPLKYKTVVHKGEAESTLLSSETVFGSNEFEALEHYFEGDVDESGRFQGRLKSHGRDVGLVAFTPRRRPPLKGVGRVGPFSIALGTFENVLGKTTLSDEVHARLTDQAKDYGGVLVYRDGLRVMPYGRTDSDIFMIEERRSKNAGRYFWSHRQCFGRVAFTREANPNLKDKAGREGLVDNQAKREMIRLIEDLLVDLARRFFGRESNIRQELMPGIMAANQLAKESLKKAKKTTQKNFSKFIRSNSDEMKGAVAKVVNINQELRHAVEVDDSHKIILLMEKEDELSQLRSKLKLPPLPAKLGNVEKAYRAYRDNYLEMTAALQSFTKMIAEIYETHIADQKDKVVRRKFHSNQAILNSKIKKWIGAIDDRLKKLGEKWEKQAGEDRHKYYEKASPVVDDIDSIGFGRALNVLDVYRNEFEDDFTVTYESFLRSLDKLEDDINLDSALWIVEKENTDLEEQVKKLNNLAQLGVAVEIIGHELDTLDSEVGRNLMRLPRDVRNTEAFKLTYESYKALVNRLRFLAPMKLAGYQAREDISGEQIAEYIENFFHRHFQETRIEFVATQAFRKMTVRDLVSRIYPVFINLINNAVYWLRYVEERKLVLDVVEDKVIIADSGEGVDQDDIPHLFDIFFSRRPKGRGVGLYLCKVNLAVAYHNIYYVEDESIRILPGANFAIEFKGMNNA